MTAQRKVIRDVIWGSDGHLTSEQIYFLAKEKMPSISLGTVYRNLSLMSDEKEITRISIPGSPDHFDKNTVPHQHICCAKCGRLEDVELPGLGDLIKNAVSADVISYSLSIKYLCPDCAAKARTESGSDRP